MPLDAINKASAREKSIRHGHPSTLHLWWARRPLAAARAVIFAQMVDDPSSYVDVLLSDPKKKRAAERELKKRLAEHAAKQALADDDSIAEPEPTLEEVIADIERDRLFSILEDLVLWKNTTNEEVLQRARDEIWQSWRRACADNADHPRAKELFDRSTLPGFHDPFAGGGALPLEAQRLGLESYASDLNPVAVLINRAMIEIPLKHFGKPPINPESQKDKDLFTREWRGAQGLAEDVKYYAQWMRGEAAKRIGHLYPMAEVTSEMASARPDLEPYVGNELTVIAWIWARTVKSPNPAFADVDVPLASTFMLSTKKGKEAYLEPVIEGGSYRFTVKVGKPPDWAAAKGGTKLSRGANFRCLMSGTPIAAEYIKNEGKAGRMGARLMAIVAEGNRERVFLPPSPRHEAVSLTVAPEWKPEVAISGSTQYLGIKPYGMDQFDQLFTNRQLVTLTVFADLVDEVRERVARDAMAAGVVDDVRMMDAGGAGSRAYADCVAIYMALCVSKSADYWSSICIWRSDPKNLGVGHVFARQAIQMTWDYAEGNPFSSSSGSWVATLDWITRFVAQQQVSSVGGHVDQVDASAQTLSRDKVVSTDPPYYDNVPYADLADFFYVWLRRSLRQVLPSLFATLATPKTEELVAFAYRHDGKARAEAFFLGGMTEAMHRIAELTHPGFPVTIYYAFKQAEGADGEGAVSTGWETFLDAVVRAGFATTGTWPIRTEMGNRTRGMGSNALASSIILVCRPRERTARTVTRRELVSALKAELPKSLAQLQRGNIAPVDLAQAAIGPGMAVYTRYARVLDAEGHSLSVREALSMINQTLDEVLAEQEGDFDADSRWALTWFEHSGFDEGEYGVAEQLSKAKNTSVDGLVEASILASKGGKVRLLRPEELPSDWDPAADSRLTTWEMLHQMIRVLESDGESAASILAAKLGAKAEAARELCYRLYTLCERKKRAAEAVSYNALVRSWPEIMRLAQASDRSEPSAQGELL